MAKIEPVLYGDRKVYPVASFNRGLAQYIARIPTVWVEGEVTELRRSESWASVYLTLKDVESGACLRVTIPRSRFDALDLGLADGERVHVEGRPELYEARGSLSFRARTIERFGEGEHAAALARLRRTLEREGLFAPGRKRALPRFPCAVGLLTGTDAAARGDLVTAIATRYPPAWVVVCETRVQGRGAPPRIVDGLRLLAAHPAVDVVVVARGGGSFEDLLPFSDERVVRAVASCTVPVVSAVGHEQDEPLCDLAADARASTPTGAARLVVPDYDELASGLSLARERIARATQRVVARDRDRLERSAERLRAAPARIVERRRAALDATAGRLRALSPTATVERGYAIVRSAGAVVTRADAVAPGDRLDVELASGGLGALVEETRA